ncbi:DUF6879 family protein [Prauserella muralis]|uniref:DUF6879 family protein n=1 Tax=Prauserella muralis TaxID=588067 RepID=UPI00319E13C7
MRYLRREQADTAGLPNHDCWLFDSRLLVLMRFTNDDRFLGAEIIDDPSQVVRPNYWRDAAWHYATRRNQFAAG